MEAIEYATKLHSGQKRKILDIDYISHPFAVAMMLKMYGYCEGMVAAGILHDTIEDTTTSYETLKEKFGIEVAEIVCYLSEDYSIEDWYERKRKYLETVERAPEEVLIVGCADKIHNMMTMIETKNKIGDEIWSHFEKGEDDQKWYYQTFFEILEKRFERPFGLMTLYQEYFQQLFS